MAERIEIAQLNIDVDAVIKKQQETAKSIEILKNAQKSLRDSGKQTSRAFIENDATLKTLNKTYRDGQKFTASLLSVNKDLDRAMSSENKTVQELRDSRNQLIAISSQITGDSKEEVQLREQLNTAVDGQTEAIRSQSSEFSASKDKVGEYQQAIEKAIPSNSILGRAISTVKNILNIVNPIYKAYASQISSSVKGIVFAARGTEGLTKAQKAQVIITNIATNAFKLFRIALAATGIGLIVLALASLVSFLGSTQEGIDKVNRVLKPLEVIFSRLFGIIQDLGKALFDAFSNPKQLISDIGDSIKKNLETRFNAVVRILKNIANFEFGDLGSDLVEATTGVQNLGEKAAAAFQNAKGFLEDSIALGEQLADLTIEIEEGENALVLQRAELLRLIKEENKIAEDVTLSLQERERAAVGSVEASKQLLVLEQGILDKKIQQKEIENSLNDTSRADQKELNELIAERIDKETQALELQTTQTNKVNTIRKEAAALATKQAKEARDRSAKAAKEAVDNLKVELEIYKETNKEKLAADGELSQARIEAALSAESFIKDEQLRILQERLDAGLVKENEYALEKLKIQNAFNERRTELEVEFQEQQDERREEREEAEKERKDKEIEIAEEEKAQKDELALLETENEFERQSLQLEQQKAAEIANAEAIGASTNDIEKKYAKLESDLVKKQQEQKASLYADVFGQVASLFGEQTAVAKAAGIAEATINTYLGASKALAELPPPISYVAAAATIASGLSSVAKIAGVQFADGGILNGPSHAMGGIKTPFGEVEGGEAVINKRSTSMFRPLLSQINAAGGGRRFAQGGVFGSNNALVQSGVGGISALTQQAGNVIDYDLLGQKVAEANMQIPRPVVSVADITEVSDQVVLVEEGANV